MVIFYHTKIITSAILTNFCTMYRNLNCSWSKESENGERVRIHGEKRQEREQKRTESRLCIMDINTLLWFFTKVRGLYPKPVYRRYVSRDLWCKLTEPYSVPTGVSQRCLLSHTIFLIVVDWVMRKATTYQRTDILRIFMKREDIDFAEKHQPWIIHSIK